MQPLIGLLKLSPWVFLAATVASIPVDVSNHLGFDPSLPLVGKLTWFDQDRNIIAELTQELDQGLLRTALPSFNGTFFDPSDAEKAAALVVAENGEADIHGIRKRATRCYTWGSKIESRFAHSYCNQLCNIRSAGYYLGSYSYLVISLFNVWVEMPPGAPAGFGTLVAIITNRIADNLFVSPGVCMSYCVPSLTDCHNFGADNDLYAGTRFLGDLSIDPGSYCVNPQDANRPTQYPTCRA